MSMRRIAALQSVLVMVAMLANASSPKNTIRITVLDSATQASAPDNNNGVPNNCEQLTFDAYCRSSTNTPLVSTLLVQEGNNPPFRISCKIESKFSRCTPLPKGETFDAKRGKHGITVYFEDEKGKERSELYALVDADGKASPATTAAVAAVPTPAVAGHAPQAAAPASPAAATNPAPANAPVPAHVAPAVILAQQAAPASGEKVRCSFTSTPPGAEIEIDGKYVGNTPSEIAVSAGSHRILFSMDGFNQWKRDLTVMAGSELTVSGVLQKK